MTEIDKITRNIVLYTNYGAGNIFTRRFYIKSTYSGQVWIDLVTESLRFGMRFDDHFSEIPYTYERLATNYNLDKLS